MSKRKTVFCKNLFQLYGKQTFAIASQ